MTAEQLAYLRRVRRLMPDARLTRAVAAKRRAELEYRAALQAAADSGMSFAQIARTAGISRQAARQAVRRAGHTA